MVLVVMFIFGAVILGAGAMLSPAWLTPQPRVGLSGALAIALVIGGAVFWAFLFGWDILVIDYMLFALVTGIFLTGTLSVGQLRAEGRGEVLEDAEQGWTGPQDLLFFALVALAFIIPGVMQAQVEVNPAVIDPATAIITDSFDLVTAARETQLAPGFPAIASYLSHQLNVGLDLAEIGVAAVFGLLAVWVIYDFGSETEHKRLGRGMGAALLLGIGWYLLFLDAQSSLMIALTIALAFMTYAYRYLKDGYPTDLVAAGLMFGAVLIVHVTVFAATLAGFVVWLILVRFAPFPPAPPLRRWLTLLAVVPLIAFIATAPYTLSAFPLNGLDLALTNTPIYPLLIVWSVLLAVPGIVIGMRDRRPVALMASAWLVGGLPIALVAPPVMVMPLAIFGGIALLSLWEVRLAPVLVRPLESLAGGK